MKTSIKTSPKKTYSVINNLIEKKISKKKSMPKTSYNQQDLFVKAEKVTESENLNLESLIDNALLQWKKEFENQEVKTESIGDLERLIKLRILLKEENESNSKLIQEIMSKVIDVLKDAIDDSEIRVKVYERLKEIEIG
jgi:hypothetical protein